MTLTRGGVNLIFCSAFTQFNWFRFEGFISIFSKYVEIKTGREGDVEITVISTMKRIEVKIAMCRHWEVQIRGNGCKTILILRIEIWLRMGSKLFPVLHYECTSHIQINMLIYSKQRVSYYKLIALNNIFKDLIALSYQGDI